MKELNPISKKIKGLIDSGLSREKICVAAEITFWALKLIFDRNVVSKPTILSFLRANLITEDDKNEYDEWFRSQKRPTPKHKKRSERIKRNTKSKE